MTVRKFGITDASFERSPGQSADVFAGNVIDRRHGGPITIGFGRYGPNQSIDETHETATFQVDVMLRKWQRPFSTSARTSQR
jgi:ethanolamine utilization protein EutQ (cupin superfamily)